MTEIGKESTVFIASGAAIGAGFSTTIGGVGLVGSFGGIGIGVTPMTAAGAFVGMAAYGAFKGIEEGDASTLAAMGLGSIAGVGISATIGGMGLSVGGTAVGIGMGTMAAAGGIFGLGIYGIARMFGSVSVKEPVADTFARIEDKISYLDAYNQAMMELDPKLAEILWQQKFADIEVEEELQELKAKINQNYTNTSDRSKYFVFKETSSVNTLYTNNSITREYEWKLLDVEEELEKLKAENELKNFKYLNNSTKKHNYQPEEINQNYINKSDRFKILNEQSQTKTSVADVLENSWQCLKTLKGHTALVNSIAINPQNNILASVSDDKNIILWNLNTGKQIYTFFGQPQEVYGAAISPNGQKLITGDFAGKISCWNLENKKYIATFFNSFNSSDSHKGIIYSLAFSPDGKTVISSSADRTIRLWDSHTGKLKFTCNGHTDSVYSVAISSDSQIIASGSVDRTIRLWNFNHPLQQPRILIGHSQAVTSVAITQNSQLLVSASLDGTIKIWKLATGELLKSWRGHESAIRSIAITSIPPTPLNKDEGEILASGSIDGMVQLWCLKTGKLLETLAGSHPLVFSSDGKTLVTGGKNHQIKVWQQISDRDKILTGEWWEVLEIDRNATKSEVKKAFHYLARKYHPDFNQSAIAKANMQILNLAYKQSRLS
jgi:WD40 repeat protein